MKNKPHPIGRLFRTIRNRGYPFWRYLGQSLARAGAKLLKEEDRARELPPSPFPPLALDALGDQVSSLSDPHQRALQERLEHTWYRKCEDQGIFLHPPNPLGHPRESLRRKSLPVLVGPWLSEVGFEVLYWLPFLKQFLARYDVSPNRVIAISRGGPKSWYAGLAAHYVDAFDLSSPEDFVAENDKRERAQGGKKKQKEMVSLEKRLLEAAAAKLGLREYAVVHPALMYRFFLYFWNAHFLPRRILAWCHHAPLQANFPHVEGLPFDDYVAVKFYFSECFPQTPENELFLKRWIAHLAKRTKVVLLHTGFRLDDHRDAEGIDMANVFDARHLMNPRNNLEVQTALVSRARGLYCTYGGFSYLGPLLGVKTMAFYSKLNFQTVHLEVAYRALSQNPEKGLTVLPTTALDDFFAKGDVA